MSALGSKRTIFYCMLLIPTSENYLDSGAPGEIRTPDHLVRSQVLYPAELRAQIFAPAKSALPPSTVVARKS